MNLPGCPDRHVEQVDWDRFGVTLRLSCGHRLFMGGHPSSPQLHFIVGEDMVPCQQGPCYQRQTYFGD